MPRQDHGAFGDILGVIADALQGPRDLHVAEDIAQVVGHGLAPGDDRERAGLDLPFALIEFAVPGDDAIGGLVVALHQRFHGRFELGFH